MSKFSTNRKLELKNLSPLRKQKFLADKIYSPGSRGHKKKIFSTPVATKQFLEASLCVNRISKVPKTNESSKLPTQSSATPKGIEAIDRRGNSLSSHPIKKLPIGLGRLRKFSVNPTLNVIKKFHTITQTGFIPDYPQKVNQDSYIEIHEKDLSIFGVFDGHGVNGGEVSNYIKVRISALIPRHSRDLKISIKNAIITISDELTKTIDTQFSGSTLNLVVIKGKKLYCANVGDSRSIIGNQVNDINSKKSTGRNWIAVSLSRDHKPDLHEESQRIHQSGGRVLSYTDEAGNLTGPARVWLKDQNIPGLAMSRSIGDSVAASVGVISEPDILEYDLTSQDKFIVIASDGVFEFLSNEDIVKIVVPYWKTENVIGACQVIANTAEFKWRSVKYI